MSPGDKMTREENESPYKKIEIFLLELDEPNSLIA